MEKTEDRNRLLGMAMVNLAICYDLVKQNIEKELRPQKLNMTQLSLLTHFMRNSDRDWTVTQLVEVMSINQPGITKATNSMIAAGWLKRNLDAEDARIKRLTITPSGLETLHMAQQLLMPVLKDFFAPLDDESLSIMVDNLMLLKNPKIME